MDVYAFHKVTEENEYVIHEMAVRDPYTDWYDFPYHDERWHALRVVYDTALFQWDVWVDMEHIDTISTLCREGWTKSVVKTFTPHQIMGFLFC